MNYNKIVNHLYFGNDIPTSPLFHLIVNCTHEIPFSPFCEIRVRIPVNDDSEDCGKIIQLLLKTNVLQKIHRCILRQENVLVHCFGDEPQRSFVIVVCYFIYYYNYTPKQAVQFIHKMHFIYFLDDIHFIKSIFDFYDNLQKKNKIYVKN